VTGLIVCGELEGIMKNLLWLNCVLHSTICLEGTKTAHKKRVGMVPVWTLNHTGYSSETRQTVQLVVIGLTSVSVIVQ
jgi:hypothetical protein